MPTKGLRFLGAFLLALALEIQSFPSVDWRGNCFHSPVENFVQIVLRDPHKISRFPPCQESAPLLHLGSPLFSSSNARRQDRVRPKGLSRAGASPSESFPQFPINN